MNQLPNYKSFTDSIGIIKEILIELTKHFRNGHNRDEELGKEFWIDCSNTYYDVEYDSGAILGIRLETESQYDTPKLPLKSNASYRIIAGDTSYICASNVGLIDSTVITDINGDHVDYINLLELDEELLFQYSTLYPQYIFDIIKLEEEVREYLDLQTQQHPLFYVLDVTRISELQDDLPFVLEKLKETNRAEEVFRRN